MEKDELELTNGQVMQLEDLNNAAYEYLNILAFDQGLEWDVESLHALHEFASGLVVRKGYKAYYPSIVSDENGTRRENYYEPEPEIEVTLVDDGDGCYDAYIRDEGKLRFAFHVKKDLFETIYTIASADIRFVDAKHRKEFMADEGL